MILTLPDTTTHAVNKQLVDLRDEGGAVALGRVLTLIIDTTDADAEAAIEAANDASREHPCRVIAIARGNRELPNRLDAQIRVGGDAGASEVIVLHLHGELADHGAAVVVPLLLPDAPIVAWWPQEIPDDPANDPLGRMAQRRITDTAACADSITALAQLKKHHRAGDTDLAWTRLTHWRARLAAALDLPPYEPVDRAVIIGNANSPSTELLAAWLAWALRCPVKIEGRPDVIGFQEVRLERQSGPVILARPNGGDTATLRQPGQPDREVSLPVRSMSECLTEELRRLDPDEVYGEALTHGLDLVATA